MAQRNVTPQSVDELLRGRCRFSYLREGASYLADEAGIHVGGDYIGCRRMSTGRCTYPNKMQDCVLPHIRWIGE